MRLMRMSHTKDVTEIGGKGDLDIISARARAVRSGLAFCVLPARGRATHDVKHCAVADVGVAQRAVVRQHAPPEDQALRRGAGRRHGRGHAGPEGAYGGVCGNGERVRAAEGDLHGDADWVHLGRGGGGEGWLKGCSRARANGRLRDSGWLASWGCRRGAREVAEDFVGSISCFREFGVE